MTHRRQTGTAIALASLVAIGCSTRAPSAPSYAFENLWTKPHANWSTYAEIAVRPVNVEALTGTVDRRAVDPSAETTQAQALGAYMEQALKEALRSYPCPRLQFVEHPGPKTVVVDAALVGVMPGPDRATGTSTALPTGRQIGMEIELRDGVSGEVIAAIGDRASERRASANSPAGVNHGGAEPIVDEWAMQIAGLVNSRKVYSPLRPIDHPWPAIMGWGH